MNSDKKLKILIALLLMVIMALSYQVYIDQQYINQNLQKPTNQEPIFEGVVI